VGTDQSAAATANQAAEAQIRSPTSLLGSFVLAGILTLLPRIDSVRDVLGVSVRDVAVSMGVVVVISTIGFFFTRWVKDARLLEFFDASESAAVQAAVLWLVFASGRGDSFFWLLAMMHMLLAGTSKSPRFHYALAALGPLCVAAAFWLVQNKLGPAAISLAVGCLLSYVHWFARGAHQRLVALEMARRSLATALETARIEQERLRISRDLHDGVGADLAALAWRLSNLTEQQPSAPLREDLGELRERLVQGATDLRSIVWAMRSPAQTWLSICEYLRGRSVEMCGAGPVLDFNCNASEQSIDGNLALAFIRSVLELVRNAVRHAGAHHLKVSMFAERDRLFAEVLDDGCGLADDTVHASSGGLRNVRQRIAELGGELRIEASPEKRTSLAISLPIGTTT
jgi:signal transduction histidine kinase